MSENFEAFSQENWDCSSQTYLFLRESHEDNSKIGVGYRASNRIMYNRTAIFAWPSEKMKTTKGIIDITTEKKFREVCYGVLAQQCRKISAEDAYAEWDSTHSVTKKTM